MGIRCAAILLYLGVYALVSPACAATNGQLSSSSSNAEVHIRLMIPQSARPLAREELTLDTNLCGGRQEYFYEVRDTASGRPSYRGKLCSPEQKPRIDQGLVVIVPSTI